MLQFGCGNVMIVSNGPPEGGSMALKIRETCLPQVLSDLDMCLVFQSLNLIGLCNPRGLECRVLGNPSETLPNRFFHATKKFG